MEITLDIEKIQQVRLIQLPKRDGVEFDIAALKLLDLGIRFILQVLKKWRKRRRSFISRIIKSCH